MAQYTIAYDGVDGEGNEARIAIPDIAYAGGSFFALTDAPLYRGDTLRFNLVPGTLPTPLPGHVYVSVDGVDAGAWTLIRQSLDVETGAFVAYEAKREADAQEIADAVMGILLTDVDGYNRDGIPPIQKRWAAILDGDLNGWIARRILGKGDKPTLDTLLRELPKYGYQLTLADVAPFNNAAIPISIVPLAVAAQTAPKPLPQGYRLTQYEEPLINPLTRRLTFTAGEADYFGGSGHAAHLGLAPTLGEGAVLLEMRRYHDYYTQERLTAEMPIAAYGVRDLVRTGRDTPPRDWIVESVSHTEVATQLRLIRNKALTPATLMANSPAPYNTSARPYNAKPGVPSVRIQYVFKSDDPRTAAEDITTIDWRTVGGGAVAVITPPRFGHPLTRIHWQVRRKNAQGNYVLTDGAYYLEGDIEEPPPILPVYVPLMPMLAGDYDITVYAVNAYDEGQRSSAVQFTITAGFPEMLGILALTTPDVNASESLSLEAQRRMFTTAEINKRGLISSAVGTALAVTGTSIALAAAVFGTFGAYAIISAFGLTGSVGISSIITASGWAAGVFAAPFVVPFFVATLPIAAAAGLTIYGRLSAPRIALIARVFGAGRMIGVQIQVRRSTLRVSRQGTETRAWTDWADIGDLPGADFGNISHSAPTLATLDYIARKRLLQTDWIATYGSANQAGIGGRAGFAVQFQYRPWYITGVHEEGHDDAGQGIPTTPARGYGAFIQTPVYDVRQWTARQFGDDGNLLDPAIPTEYDFEDPPPF